MGKSILRIMWGVVIAVIATLLFYYVRFTVSTQIGHPKPVNAIFDLQNSNLTNNRIIDLVGSTFFYDDTLLTSINRADTCLKPTGESLISDSWNKLKYLKKEKKGHGYGTFYFQIVVPETGLYGLKIKDIKSAYRLFVNGEDLGGSGVVGTSRELMKPSRYQKEYYFSTTKKIIDVTIQVSNFHHRKAGLTGSIVFGKPGAIAYKKSKQAGIELFIIGSLFILFIYHLALFVYRRKDRSILYFSLLCFAMFLRLGYIGEKIMLELMSFFSWHISIRLEYISFFAIPLFTTLFIRELFSIELPKHIAKIVTTLCLICMILVLFLTPTLFSYVPIVSLIPLGILAIYLLGVIILAYLRKRDYSGPVFIGFLVYFIFSIHDALNYTDIINSISLMPLGLWVATLSQAYVLAKKTSFAYFSIEKLSDELSQYAHNLEQVVEKRTAKIKRQKEKIEKQKVQAEKSAIQLKETNQQLLELAQFKKDTTGMLVHDLKSPLQSILGLTELSAQSNKYSKHILSAGWQMENLISNILEVDRYNSPEFKLSKTKVSLSKIVDEAFESSYFIVTFKNISLHNEVPEDYMLNLDHDAILRVFANLYSNAAKYGGENIYIKVSTEEVVVNDKKYLKTRVYNSGKPIGEDKIDSIFTKYNKDTDNTETSSYSTGIGLTFCKLAVDAHHGAICVASGKDKGVTFEITLPL